MNPKLLILAVLFVIFLITIGGILVVKTTSPVEEPKTMESPSVVEPAKEA